MQKNIEQFIADAKNQEPTNDSSNKLTP